METIPFFSNTADNSHCFQAALRMVLKYFEPEKNYSFEELDKLTAKVKDLWTWPLAGILSFVNNNYDVVILDAFDYAAFSEKGEEYLIRLFGKEVANEQIKNSNIKQEVKFTKKLLAKKIIINPKPSLTTAKKLIKDGYLVIFNVNSQALNNKNGYVGHFVVVYKIDNDFIYFQDPGLPPVRNRKETIEKFNEAWKVTKDAYAFKLII